MSWQTLLPGSGTPAVIWQGPLSASATTAVLGQGPLPASATSAVLRQGSLPACATTAVHLQAVRGFGQIAAQKKQLGLLPAVQPPTASVPYQAKPDAQQQHQQQHLQQQQQEHEQQPPRLSSTACCNFVPCQADKRQATAFNQQHAKPDVQAEEPVLPPCAAQAACSSSATHASCTSRPGQAHGGAQVVPQVVSQVVPEDVPQIVLQSVIADAPQPKATDVDAEPLFNPQNPGCDQQQSPALLANSMLRHSDAEPLFNPQQMPVTQKGSKHTAGCDQQVPAALQAYALLLDSNAEQPAVGFTGCERTQAPQAYTRDPPSGHLESNQAKVPQVQSQLAPIGLTSPGVAAAVKLTTAPGAKQAVQGQGCGPVPRRKRPSATAQHAGEQAAKRAKPAGTRAASGAGSRRAPEGQSGKAAKLSACGKGNTAGKACTGGKARSAGKARPGLLSSPHEQPSAPLQLAVSQTVIRRSLRARKSAPVTVDDTSAEEDSSSSDYLDSASAIDCDPADDSLHAGGSNATHHTHSQQLLAADSLPESSDASVMEEQTHGREVSSMFGGKHQEEQSVVSSSGADADSDVGNAVSSPEQPATKAGKRKRASSRGGVHNPAGPQRAKRDSAGSETGQQSGAMSASRGGKAGSGERASASRGGRGGKRINARHNFVRCNLKASFRDFANLTLSASLGYC